MVDVQYNIPVVSKNKRTITYIPVKHVAMYICVYREDITWWCEDMDFIFEW